MSRIISFSIFIMFSVINLHGIIVGNPSDPCLYTNGLISSCAKNYSFRISYLYNNVYKGKFQDKFPTLSSTPSDIRYLLQASIATFNIYNRLDLYAILGTTNLQIDQMVYTNRKFAWGAGFKVLLYKQNCFDLSLDGKYFQTNQKPQYFVVDKSVYPLATSLQQTLEEYQASLALSYKTNFLIPYIGTTFLYSVITPEPKGGLLTLPGGESLFFDTSDSISREKWGMALGISIINKKNQANLNIETRIFDQNAFSFLGTLRF
ncbi:MAG: major outer membrane protein [uncultured bacterium]|nr:MAG: major outer membrane protein [uncultured bacterium]